MILSDFFKSPATKTPELQTFTGTAVAFTVDNKTHTNPSCIHQRRV